MKRKLFIIFIVVIPLIFSSLIAQTWSSLIRLTWNTGNSSNPSIATDSGSGIHLVWEDLTPGNYDIFYKRSTDSGIVWSVPTRLTWNAESTENPVISTDSSSGIHVVWANDTLGVAEIFYKRSSDGGIIWSGLARLTWNSGGSVCPYIAADSGRGIHVVWADNTPGNQEIFYKHSTDSGTTWSGPARLTWTADDSYTPSIATDLGNRIHVVWYDNLGPSWQTEIFYKCSTDSGVTWSGPTRLTWNAGSSYDPSIAADSGSGIHVVWVDNTPGKREIFYKSSTDSGATWSGPTRLTWYPKISAFPNIATDSGSGIHVVWYNNTLEKPDIFYKSSSDSGATWSGPTRLTWNAYSSWYPVIAVDSGNGLHVVWANDTPGNSDIYYKNRK